MHDNERIQRLGWTLALKRKYQIAMLACDWNGSDNGRLTQALERRERARRWAKRYTMRQH
jgi:hypothetical protein